MEALVVRFWGLLIIIRGVQYMSNVGGWDLATPNRFTGSGGE